MQYCASDFPENALSHGPDVRIRVSVLHFMQSLFKSAAVLFQAFNEVQHSDQGPKWTQMDPKWALPVDPLFRRSASLSVKRTQNQSVNSNLAPLELSITGCFTRKTRA